MYPLLILVQFISYELCTNILFFPITFVKNLNLENSAFCKKKFNSNCYLKKTISTLGIANLYST